MTTLGKLSVIYLAAASAFTTAVALQRHPDWSRQANRAAVALNDHVVRPAWQFATMQTSIVAADVEVAMKPAPVRVAVAAPPQAKTVLFPAIPQPMPRPALAESNAPLLRPAIVETTPKPMPRVAEAVPRPQLAPEQPQPDLNAPSAAEIARVSERLRDSLTPEMLQHFSLFLFVSKADAGPLAQRMYVYRKQDNGDLALLYDWPVSTGREKIEFAPNGAREPTVTPQGYFEIDPHRTYVRYHSMQWDQPMPYAMFFNWVHDGDETGLAIHGASGEDIGLLGQRASAGCIRLAPENARLLFTLIRHDYRGLMPKFAYDKRTATMSNDGVLVHDADGRVALEPGYKVLVLIENIGGKNVVAALF